MAQVHKKSLFRLIDAHGTRVCDGGGGGAGIGWRLSRTQLSNFICDTIVTSSGRLILDSATNTALRSLPTRDARFLAEWKKFLADLTAGAREVLDTFALESVARPVVDQLFTALRSTRTHDLQHTSERCVRCAVEDSGYILAYADATRVVVCPVGRMTASSSTKARSEKICGCRARHQSRGSGSGPS